VEKQLQQELDQDCT